MLPLPRPHFSGQLNTDLIARTEIVSARRLLGLRPLPVPVNNIASLATTCEQGSATREPVVRSGSTSPGPIDLSPTAHTNAGSDACAGAVEQFRCMPEGNIGDTGIEKDKHELLSIFASRRDAGHILEVTEGDIASPIAAAHATLRWPVPRAETRQNRPTAPVPVSSTYHGSSKRLNNLEAAERARRDEDRLLGGLSVKALAKDKRDLLMFFASGRDAGFILET